QLSRLAPSALLASSLLLGAVVPGHAQTVAGRVIEAASEVPIPGAALHVLDPEGRLVFTALAGADGAFVLPVPATPGSLVRVEHYGHASVSFDPADPPSGDGSEVEVRLAVAVVPLQPPTIAVERVARLEPGAVYA